MVFALPIFSKSNKSFANTHYLARDIFIQYPIVELLELFEHNAYYFALKLFNERPLFKSKFAQKKQKNKRTKGILIR